MCDKGSDEPSVRRDSGCRGHHSGTAKTAVWLVWTHSAIATFKEADSGPIQSRTTHRPNYLRSQRQSIVYLSRILACCSSNEAVLAMFTPRPTQPKMSQPQWVLGHPRWKDFSDMTRFERQTIDNSLLSEVGQLSNPLLQQCWPQTNPLASRIGSASLGSKRLSQKAHTKLLVAFQERWPTLLTACHPINLV